MQNVLDVHSHTIASGHAYNTLTEMTHAACKKGLELFAVTEHGPAMAGSCKRVYFQNLRVVRRSVGDMELLLGAELNIIDYNGGVDLDEDTLQCLDISIASLHIPCLKPGTAEENTAAYIGVMKNPYVDILGHPDDSRYPLDYNMLVQAAARYNMIIELNNSSLNPQGFRKDTKKNDIIILNLCKQYEVPVVLNSDAHVAEDIGNCCFSMEVIRETEFPEKLILNTEKEKFKEYLNKRREMRL